MPVSYTHLDVYKRQVLAVVLVGVIAATYYHMMVRIRRSYAVSYTHLDVYKRQVYIFKVELCRLITADIMQKFLCALFILACLWNKP